MRLRLLPIVAAAVCAAAPAGAAAASLPADATAILSGTTTLDAPLPAPAGGSAAASEAASQDGRFVAFSSVADGLFDGDDDTVENVYVKDLQTGAVTLASRRDGANGEPSHARCASRSPAKARSTRRTRTPCRTSTSATCSAARPSWRAA